MFLIIFKQKKETKMRMNTRKKTQPARMKEKKWRNVEEQNNIIIMNEK